MARDRREPLDLDMLAYDLSELLGRADQEYTGVPDVGQDEIRAALPAFLAALSGQPQPYRLPARMIADTISNLVDRGALNDAYWRMADLVRWLCEQPHADVHLIRPAVSHWKDAVAGLTVTDRHSPTPAEALPLAMEEEAVCRRRVYAALGEAYPQPTGGSDSANQ
jgi:hypothetical protein